MFELLPFFFSMIGRKRDVSIQHTLTHISYAFSPSLWYSIIIDLLDYRLPQHTPLNGHCVSVRFLLLLHWLMWKSDLISATSHAGWFCSMHSRWYGRVVDINTDLPTMFNWKKKHRNHHFSDSVFGISILENLLLVVVVCLYWSLRLIKWFIV